MRVCTPIVRYASIACFPIFCFFRAVVAAKIDLLVASFARVAASLLICYFTVLLLLLCGRISVNMFCKAPTGVMRPGTDYRQSDISAKE